MKGLLKGWKKSKGRDGLQGFTIENVLNRTSSLSTLLSKWKAFAGRLNCLGRKYHSPPPPAEAGKANKSPNGLEGSCSSPEVVGPEVGRSLEAEAGESKRGKSAKVNNTTKPSVYMQDFLDRHTEAALDDLLADKKGPFNLLYTTALTKLKFLDALFYAIDGNFHVNLKDKRMDIEDFPLSKGAAYFADEDAFAGFSAKLPPLGPEPSTCHKFKAMGYGPYWGKVSGMVGLFCARHMMVLPGGHVDLQKGERFVNYQLYFEKRMKELWEMREQIDAMKVISEKPFLKTVAGIRKFHALGHNKDCRAKWGISLQPGGNQVDSKAPERVWLSINALGDWVQEMNPGNRHDHMNEQYTASLVKKLKEGRLHLPRITKALDSLEGALVKFRGQQLLDGWRKEEKEWLEKVVIVEEKKNLPNLYDLVQPSAKSMKEIEEEIKQKFADAQYGVDLARVIQEGIALQETKASIFDVIARHDGKDHVADMQKKFENHWMLWCNRHGTTMGPLIARASNEGKFEDFDDDPDFEPDEDTRGLDDDLENGLGNSSDSDGDGDRKNDPADDFDELSSHGQVTADGISVILPSSCPASMRKRPCMASAVEIEITLRVGQANDALNTLQTQLITSYTFRNRVAKRDKRVAEGHVMATRSKSEIYSKEQSVRNVANKYWWAYQALVTLGYDNKEQRLKPLENKNVRPFDISMDNQELGQSKRQPSWIWDELEFLDTTKVSENFESYAEEGKYRRVYFIKIHWFRMSALKARWEEEVAVVHEEMARTVRFFKFHQHFWLDVGEKHDESEMRGHGAYAQKSVFNIAFVHERP
ncbi:uncharacterized protein PHACADRAFT_192577 [Phanerochaete carnosa HHB-10118-sp]|uniref:CxC2-like cysteine cluster KDZ transposase-associated domain-containing protein n=1 Tax=Phanerochaete carnosa (strain HHB-10118-sp) TaxID=650164 RepID=K5W0T2_PHACS|nr:uncharacterized protein PHACADRAFT_192577 [Phanerochaete carnosa HHB-10118-sp]EKM57428.1 hypothetical protein PHACADRAFT_192577 [Phanerochaete carnosa HHB-10118-sp]